MRSTGSVSRLIGDLQRGSEAAATELWARFQPRLIQFARSRLDRSAKTVADEEDVVVMAFKSFLHRTSAGDYPELSNRDEFWRLLVTITARKASNQIRDQNCQKRRPSETEGIAQISPASLVSSLPTPQFTASMNDQLNHLLDVLRDDELRQIVMLRLDGYTSQEIADELKRSLSTVERRLHLIREKWKHEFEV